MLWPVMSKAGRFKARGYVEMEGDLLGVRQLAIHKRTLWINKAEEPFEPSVANKQKGISLIADSKYCNSYLKLFFFAVIRQLECW